MFDINSVFTHAAIADINNDLYVMCRDVCDHLHSEFNTSSSSGSFVIAVKQKAKKKKNFMTVMSLFYILHKITFYQSCIFSKDMLDYRILN
jgi:hypothetical protein